MEEQGNTEFDRNLVIEAEQKRGVVGRRGGKKAVKKRGGDRERKWGNREKRDESSPPSSTPPEEESREYRTEERNRFIWVSGRRPWPLPTQRGLK